MKHQGLNFFKISFTCVYMQISLLELKWIFSKFNLQILELKSPLILLFEHLTVTTRLGNSLPSETETIHSIELVKN